MILIYFTTTKVCCPMLRRFGHKEQYLDEEYNILVEEETLSRKDMERLKYKKFQDCEKMMESGDANILFSIYDMYRHEHVTRDIIHQIYNFSKEDVVTIFNCIMRNFPKKRSLVFYGPSNCGKSLLANALCTPFAPGYIQRDSGTNVHWLENIYRKCLILWEEPSIHMTNIEDVKLLLGGERLVINRKNKHLVERINKPAVIITTNKQFWEYEPNTLKSRIIIYYFYNQIDLITKKFITNGDVLDYLCAIFEGSYP